MASAIELEVTTRVVGMDKLTDSSIIQFPSLKLSVRSIISLKVRAEIESELRRWENEVAPALSLRYLIDDNLQWAKKGAISLSTAKKIDVYPSTSDIRRELLKIIWLI